MVVVVEEDNMHPTEDDDFHAPSNLADIMNGTEVQEDVETNEADEEEQVEGEPQQKKRKLPGRVTTDEFEMDIGTLLATKIHAVDTEQLSSEAQRAEYLKSLATQGAQALVEQLFTLPTESCDVGVLAVLPAPTVLLPREKPVPQPKPPTRWELFAARKGIKKKSKRSRLVFEESTGEWKPRFGANRANKNDDSWIMEHRAGEDASVDPWTKLKQEKKERVSKNKQQQVKNLIAATGHKLPGSIDLSSALKASKPAAKQAKIEKKQSETKSDGMAKAEHAKVALRLAQQSTASMGKFDKLNKGEPEPKQSRISKKASLVQKVKKAAAAGEKAKLTVASEKDASLQLLSRVLEPPKLNVQKAVAHKKREMEATNKKVNQMARAGGENNKKRKRQQRS
eukprot:TRINITY_DN17989_c0_g1_i1.p1 TRINITY_DN17989_c0_g1~~TRINITY_DN17989_c0_g1_i1.p1  ORF type:complete len:396 (-),score=146.29 TRINITY_DN17989_c0_g1_i1:89-1276(-)